MNWTINKREVNEFDLSPLAHYVCHDVHFSRREEHYRLLGYLSKQLLPGQYSCDIGTYLGMSAVALSYGSRVYSYDIDNRRHPPIIKDVVPIIIGDKTNNIYFREDGYEFHLDEISKSSLILFDVSPHGLHEETFYNWAITNVVSGLILFDDVHNDPNMGGFKHLLSGATCYDVTDIGHDAGTFIVPINCSLEIQQ